MHHTHHSPTSSSSARCPTTCCWRTWLRWRVPLSNGHSLNFVMQIFSTSFCLARVHFSLSGWRTTEIETISCFCVSRCRHGFYLSRPPTGQLVWPSGLLVLFPLSIMIQYLPFFSLSLQWKLQKSFKQSPQPLTTSTTTARSIAHLHKLIAATVA